MLLYLKKMIDVITITTTIPTMAILLFFPGIDRYYHNRPDVVDSCFFGAIQWVAKSACDGIIY